MMYQKKTQRMVIFLDEIYPILSLPFNINDFFDNFR